MRKSLMMMTAALFIAACSNNDAGPTKRVSADGTSTLGIVADGAKHVAYVLNASAGYGAKGELHVSDPDGKDVKIAANVSVGGYLFSQDGKGLLFEVASTGNDASLSWVDVSNLAAPPKPVFPGGLQQSPITPGTTAPTFATPLLQQGFVSPSGRFYVVGVLAPDVGVSPDLHVIDMDTGTDVFQRNNGAFDYLELVLPNDVMVYQDAVGGNDGIAGGAGLQTLFWVDLTSASPTATTIATRTGAYTPTGDNKNIVYQDADTRELYVWDAVARPATGTKVASNALTFAVADSGPIAYVGTDGSIHVVRLDGTPVVDVAAATAKADLFTPMYISDDGADVYYFQTVATQNGQGTLMHLAATAGATPSKIADSASLQDVHPLPGGVLLYLANVDGTGQAGDAFKSARDGSGAMPLGTRVPLGFLTVTRPSDITSADWLSLHLYNTTEDKNKHLVDGIRAITGALELTRADGNRMIDPMVRIGQFEVGDDLAPVAYITGAAFDSIVDNYVGSLVMTAPAPTPSAPSMPFLTGVSELGPVVGNSMFVNAPKAPKPGVYFVNVGSPPK